TSIKTRRLDAIGFVPHYLQCQSQANCHWPDHELSKTIDCGFSNLGEISNLG
ncbi:MAG: hypothetical protein ACI805_001009, partial [Candidatus Azotimanducaceae bacterium]